jgi:hypothetical protein
MKSERPGGHPCPHGRVSYAGDHTGTHIGAEGNGTLANSPPSRRHQQAQEVAKKVQAAIAGKAAATPRRVIKRSPKAGSATPRQPQSTLHTSTTTDQRRRDLGEEQIGNRAMVANQDGITSLEDFWTFIPIRCWWCRQEKPAKALKLSGMNFKCVDEKACNLVNKKRLWEKYPNTAPKKRLVVRKKAVAKSTSGLRIVRRKK